MFLSSLFGSRPAAAPTSLASPDAPYFADAFAGADDGRVTIRQQVAMIEEDLRWLTERVGDLGRSIRSDGAIIEVPSPGPVVTVSDAMEYVASRIDLLNAVVDSIERKLG